MIVLIAVPFSLVLAALTYATVRGLMRKGPALTSLTLSLVVAAIAVAVAAVRGRRAPTMRPSNTSTRRAGLDTSDIHRLAAEINDILKTSPISPQRKADLTAQLRNVPTNLSRALSRLERLRRIREIADRAPDVAYAQRVRHELATLEAEVRAQVHAMHKTLLDISVTLLRVDKASDDRSLERLMTELSATNERLDDLAASYGDVQTDRRAFNLQ